MRINIIIDNENQVNRKEQQLDVRSIDPTKAFGELIAFVYATYPEYTQLSTNKDIRQDEDESDKNEFLKHVLDTPMNNDEASSVREFLRNLLIKLWSDDEGFDPKRPFGDSSWKAEVFIALIKNHLIDGTLDKDGNIDMDFEEWDKAEAIVTEAITYLMSKA